MTAAVDTRTEAIDTRPKCNVALVAYPMVPPALDPPRIPVAAFVPYYPDSAPSQRFRIEQWLPHLAMAGIEVELLPFAGPALTALLPRRGRALRKAVLMLAGFARTLARAVALPPGRIVLVHRTACLAGPPALERMLRRDGHPMLFDFDDAIFKLHASPANRAAAWLKNPGKTATLCRISDLVVAGNAYLADWAARHNPRVTIVPTSVDTERCRPRTLCRSDGRVVVGWTGSATSQAYLEAVTPMLSALCRDRDVELRVLSTRRPALADVPHTWRTWSPATEAHEVADFDIGIMPMPDEEWALGKCALKALQYMAAGLPTVASAIGANREVIEHGRNGLLATTTEDWLEALRSLIGDPGLRHRLGAAGRQTVEQRYSMRASAAKFETAVREVAHRHRDGR